MKFKDISFLFFIALLNVALFFVLLGGAAKVIWMLLAFGWGLIP